MKNLILVLCLVFLCGCASLPKMIESTNDKGVQKEFTGSYEKIFAASEDAIDSLETWSLKESNLQEGYIHARREVQLNFPADVVITVKKVSDNASAVRIKAFNDSMRSSFYDDIFNNIQRKLNRD